MGCAPLVPLIEWPLPHRISTYTQYTFGNEMANLDQTAPISRTWTDANRATLIPLTIPSTYTVRSFQFAVGSVSSGNFDMGIYDSNGSLLRSLGSTALPAANVFSPIGIAALSLQPGHYWIAFVLDNVVGTILAQRPTNNRIIIIGGLRGINPGFPLPDTIPSFVSPADLVPFIQISDLVP